MTTSMIGDRDQRGRTADADRLPLAPAGTIHAVIAMSDMPPSGGMADRHDAAQQIGGDLSEHRCQG